MGTDLRDLFEKLQQQLLTVHVTWLEFLDLFGQGPEQIALLNRVAPLWFSVVQKALQHEIVLHITRLTDPPGSGSGKKLTLKRLP
jgi:hypothetical protein